MKYFKTVGIITLLIFSFYLTDFVTELAINSNPLMQSIKSNKSNYEVESVNAIIEDNTIIPGINGKTINEIESFLNMKDFGSFNSNYIIYNTIVPDISINNNVDKIIISGNRKLRNISLLIYNNKSLENYLLNNNIKYTKLIDYKNLVYKEDNINIERDAKKFNDLETILKKKKLNNKICILNYSNIESCKKRKYYIVKQNYIVNNNNIRESIKILNRGDIMILDDNLTIENFKILYNMINIKDLKIKFLSQIIKE